ncbi:indole-3-acetic acid-induced protein ARG7-like [Canna indica]|uniref:Indole-3-acetic acid-induced protein ARG7-like n=1 Tax=Canna indica TaxID=4628 RepID=A0AAQ3L385_9LILI|nr:indole-3-acetic acid-induced protein ARG7-like [Canna indica]
MESKKSNKITEIVRLHQILKKWKKLAVKPKATNSKSIKYLKRTLSFSENSSSSLTGDVIVPKGYLALCVGEEMRRYVIPTEYLGHGAFGALLREAEEEFGFEQEGVLRIPCEVGVFESIVKVVEKNKEGLCYCSSEAELGSPSLPPKPVCR